MASNIKEQLFHEVSESNVSPTNKVTVVGVGQVGMACAFSILTQVFIILFYVILIRNKVFYSLYAIYCFQHFIIHTLAIRVKKNLHFFFQFFCLSNISFKTKNTKKIRLFADLNCF